MQLDAGGGFLPLVSEGRVPGVFERGREIDATARRPLALVAHDAIGFDERGDAGFEELLGFGFEGGLVGG